MNARELVETVPDPEMPFLNLGDLGIVRSVVEAPDGVRVALTPTFVGCPATEVIVGDVRRVLAEAGYANVVVEVVMAPAWSSDLITPSGREKLSAAGIAPPACLGARPLSEAIAAPVACPLCGSLRTRRRSEFGSTPCKAMHVCLVCREPFEAIKPI